MLVRSGRIHYANAGAIRLLGEDCVNKSLKSLFGPEVAGTQAGSFIAGAAVGGKRCILRMSRMDGDRILFLTRAEAVPGVLNEPFLYALRSSLMSVGMCADRIRERAESLEDSGLLEVAARLTRSHFQLIRMTNNASLVMDMAGDAPLITETAVNASQLCRELLEAAKYFCPQIRLVTDLGENVSCSTDPAMLRQLLLNLLSNCLSHAQCHTVSVRLLEAGETVILSVDDDGCGIEPGRLHTVFDRYRHGFEIGNLHAGAGLGLTAVRRIVEAHGGALLLESRPGRGTTVRASFARHAKGSGGFHSPQTGLDCTRDVLIGLSDGLPIECYSEKYMD